MTTASQYGIPPVPPRKASGGVIALGVINIIYAVLFRLCCGVSAVLYGLLGEALLKVAEMQKTQLPSSLQMVPTGAVKSYLMVSGFVLLILGILLLIGGIGLLMLRPWGRSLTLGVAAAEIVWVLIDFAISVFFIFPATIQAAGGALQGPQMIGNVVLQILSAILKLVYPIILLICLNLRSVREQFEPPSQQIVS